jgi:hypothetical protein
MIFVSGNIDAPDTSYAIILGLVSIAVSIFWIGVHLNFFNMWGIQEGGWFELLGSFFLMFVWIVGLGVFTTDGKSDESQNESKTTVVSANRRIALSFLLGGIAAKMEGDECKSDQSIADTAGNCTVILFIQDSEGAIYNYEVECKQLSGEIPGSNLYYSCWSCMLSAIAVAFKWKASQALRFAQAQAERQQRSEQDAGEGYIGEDDEDNTSR